MVDLHTHSNASDGSYSPPELVALAAKQGITLLALTDHDTVAGLESAQAEALRQGIRFVPGVELEIEWEGAGEFHLLALGLRVPADSPALAEALETLSRRRRERNEGILALMAGEGIGADYGELEAVAAGHAAGHAAGRDGVPGAVSIGRPHFAELLVNRGIVKNQAQAFDRYLSRGRPFYLPKAGLNFEEAVLAIREAGGVGVLAHPLSLYLSWGRFTVVLRDLKDRGLEGIEAWHPAAKVSACRRLEEMGRSLGLLITAGSDFHGPRRPDRKLGLTAGDRPIGDEYGARFR
jgi:predicted metal-dependent phosphoesterase TrpH